MHPSLIALVGGIAAASALCGPSTAHEGHDHGDAPPGIAAPAAPRGSSSSGRLEIVAVARGGALTIYVDRVGTNEPVSEASIDAETPDGTGRAESLPDGTFRLAAPWSRKPGDHEILLTVTLAGATEVFPIDLHIPGALPPAAPAAGAGWWPIAPAFAAGVRERIAGPDAALLAAAGGFLAGVVSVLLLRRRRPGGAAVAALLVLATMVMPSERVQAHEGDAHEAPQAAAPAPGAYDQAQRSPDGAIFMPKPTQRLLLVRTVVTAQESHSRAVELPGRIMPDPNGSGLVQASAGGRLSPPTGGFPRLGTRVRRGDVLAHVTPPLQAIDASDMRQRQGELDQQMSIVERRLTRLEPLARSGAVAQAQLDEARLELGGLRDRRTALDRSRREPEALVAPVDGVVAEANAVAGQMAQSSAVVFQIIDPARLFVEALSFESLPDLPDASARMSSGRILALTYQGAGLADRNQAIPVQFAVAGDTGGLRIGELVTVVASGTARRSGVALPRTSLVRGASGQTLVYEHTGPERFEPREVRVEPLDGERVLVAAGLAPGTRIVTSGAELLNQVR